MRNAGSLAFWATSLTLLVGVAAFGPRTTIREILRDGTATVQAATKGPDMPVVAVAPSWSPVCTAMQAKIMSKGFGDAERNRLVAEFRPLCLGVKP